MLCQFHGFHHLSYIIRCHEKYYKTSYSWLSSFVCNMCKCKKGSYGDRVCKFILTFSGVFVIALQIDFVTYTSSLSMTFLIFNHTVAEWYTNISEIRNHSLIMMRRGVINSIIYFWAFLYLTITDRLIQILLSLKMVQYPSSLQMQDLFVGFL